MLNFNCLEIIDACPYAKTIYYITANRSTNDTEPVEQVRRG